MKKLLAVALLAAGLAACGDKDAKPAYLSDLAAVRSALQVYYGDAEGNFPETLSAVTGNPKYLAGLPQAKLPGHAASARVLYLQGPALDPAKLTDAGGYAYFNSPAHPATFGMVVLNCTHQDSKGRPLYSY
jgi:hypothetical protein